MASIAQAIQPNQMLDVPAQFVDMLQALFASLLYHNHQVCMTQNAGLLIVKALQEMCLNIFFEVPLFHSTMGSLENACYGSPNQGIFFPVPPR